MADILFEMRKLQDRVQEICDRRFADQFRVLVGQHHNNWKCLICFIDATHINEDDPSKSQHFQGDFSIHYHERQHKDFESFVFFRALDCRDEILLDIESSGLKAEFIKRYKSDGEE